MSARRRNSDWEDQAPKDLDPEAEHVDQSENEDGSEESEDENAGTEHYVTVGKSKLREKEGVSLGPQYRGARVSRDALNNESDGDSDVFEDAQEEFDSNDEEFDDPETADLAADEANAGDEDFEIESDNALGDSDDEKLGEFVFRGSSQPKDKKKGGRSKRPTAADFISDEEEEEEDDDEGEENNDSEDDDDDEGGIDLDEDEDDEDGEEVSEGSDEDLMEGLEGSEDEEEGSDDESAEDSEEDSDEDSDSDSKPRRKSNKADARAEQRKLMSEGQKALSATLSAAAQQDAQKGVAVREQRKTFDGLLNIRIRLQKAIVATNSFSAVDTDDFEQSSEPYEAAEEAALKLLNTLDSFRASLLPAELAQAGGKRKRAEVDASTSDEAIWEGIQEAEERALKYRKKVLETWSGKTRSATVEVKARNLISTQQSIVASLEEQLLNADRLVKRTRTPRSCAPAQVVKKINEDPEVYDDADFYQLMLKELVEQRTNDNGSAGAAAQPTVRWAAMKEAKTKKHVDRRASKGRKMRFNVHEKLQNFMAPEDRRAWEQEAIDRLFGTLFGQQMELGEAASDEEMEDDTNAEEEGLRLFRN
ncbi:protein bfr2 [Colletotrichum karsti]|uniref:Protein BFR2 n=1 Tax=Colletotrichum karsti TaxID=1095194 RepID=A0A9P6LH61_9PEZI|nr:protein bfr2 [Colletotrichum karsti]KAF9875939.1 protein bfr2 [Colletotrichum karsti]